MTTLCAGLLAGLALAVPVRRGGGPAGPGRRDPRPAQRHPRSAHDLGARIAALPAAVVDHLGMHADGLPHLLGLVEKGVRVKATGFRRVDLDPADAIRRIVAVDPSALMVGTVLPSTRARRPFQATDLDTVRDAVGPDHAAAVFWENAAAFYLSRPRQP